MPSPLDAIINEAKRVEEDAIYSAKGHWEAARRWNRWHFALGIPLTILATIGAGSAFSQHALAAGVTSALVAAGTALLTFLKPIERATQHTQAGNAYKSLHNRARIFREIDCADPNAKDLAASIKQLAADRDDLNRKLPIIPR